MTGISLKLGRRPTIALGIIGGLSMIALAIMAFIVTISAWGGGDALVPVAALVVVTIALGFTLMLRTARWADRTR